MVSDGLRSSRIVQFALILAVVAITAFVGWRSMYHVPVHEGVVSYQASRDRAAVIKLYQDNMYWVAREGSLASIEALLDTKTPTPHTADYGIARNYVYLLAGKPVGFVSWFPESFYKARLHIIVVDADYRGRGISDALMNYAMDDIKRQGMSSVNLITRMGNTSARKLYERLNYAVTWHDDNYIRYGKTL